jgi:hypothetical protein
VEWQLYKVGVEYILKIKTQYNQCQKSITVEIYEAIPDTGNQLSRHFQVFRTSHKCPFERVVRSFFAATKCLL